MANVPQQQPGPGLDVRFESKANYLLAVVSGDSASLLDALDYARQMVQESRQRGLSRILHVRDIVRPLTLRDAFLVASQLRDLGMLGLAVAVVDLRKGHEALRRCVETSAARHGLRIRFFETIADAEPWLASSPDLDKQAPQPRQANPPQSGLQR